MKIKTITCHDVYNYGASLQAFALLHFLQSKGHDVEIIDYKPYYIDFPYKISLFVPPGSPIKKFTDKSVIIRFLYSLKRFIWYLPSWKRKKAFDRFTKHYLKRTRKYNSFKDLQDEIPEADMYIVGSDQVWNSVTMLNGIDPAFYLRFVPDSKKKISYAASFGATSISKEHTSEILDWLRKLDAISVRERAGVDMLKERGIEGKHVCDPVFLLSEKEWRTSLHISDNKEKYVLIYNLTTIDQKLVSDAKRTSKQLGVKLISVSPMKIPEADENLCNVGPETFVSLIFNASYVFTNSFHATAFSIVSYRQFCTYNYHSASNSSRMYSVLEEMGLLERLNISDIEKVLDKPIDYSTKAEVILKSVNNGREWLLNNTNN